MIGKQKLPLFATIFPSFSELPVTPFSGLPIPLYTTPLRFLKLGELTLLRWSLKACFWFIVPIVHPRVIIYTYNKSQTFRLSFKAGRTHLVEVVAESVFLIEPGQTEKNRHAPICNRFHSCNSLAGRTYTVGFLTFAPFVITVSVTIATNPDTDKLQQTLRRSPTKWTCPSTPYWAFYMHVRPMDVGLRHKCGIGRGLIFR